MSIERMSFDLLELERPRRVRDIRKSFDHGPPWFIDKFRNPVDLFILAFLLICLGGGIAYLLGR